MTTTITASIDSADKTAFEEYCRKIGKSVSEAISEFVKSKVRKSAKDDDGFWSEENQRYLESQIRLYNEGKLKTVVKTMDELEAMAE